jgi:signal transduction histidine kinase
MLNSDQDLDTNPNRHAVGFRSITHAPSVNELRIEQSQAIAIFKEATAQAIRLADVPVAILTTVGAAGCQIGSISGLDKFVNLSALSSRASLQTELAGLEYCHDLIISNDRHLSIANCQKHSQLAQLPLVRVHGMQAYLGVPITTAAKDRLGVISIVDFKSHQFSDREINVLQLLSRLVASEFERQIFSQSQLNRLIGDLRPDQVSGFDDISAAIEHRGILLSNRSTDQLDHPALVPPELDSTISASSFNANIAERQLVDYPQIQGEIQFKLMTHLSQSLRTPLTAVLGMASVLQQEIYGALSSKQKDYLGIIYHSGQQLVTIVDEIAQLGGFDRQQPQIMLKPVDLEMLCQLALQSLMPLAQKKQLQINLDFAINGVESLPIANDQELHSTTKTWLLDKDKMRQIIYYLCLSLIHASAVDRQISIKFSNSSDQLQMQIVTDDPLVILTDRDLACTIGSIETNDSANLFQLRADESLNQQASDRVSSNEEVKIGQDLRLSLGLVLSCSLAASHGGKIEVMADGQGYQLTLPQINPDQLATAVN